MIVAVDFDGTLCRNTFPYIGDEFPAIIEALRDIQRAGAKLVLWTCRRDELLQVAVEWCSARGLEFDAVNANTKENIAQYGKETRKVFADYYLDDRNATIKEILGAL